MSGRPGGLRGGATGRAAAPGGALPAGGGDRDGPGRWEAERRLAVAGRVYEAVRCGGTVGPARPWGGPAFEGWGGARTYVRTF